MKPAKMKPAVATDPGPSLEPIAEQPAAAENETAEDESKTVDLDKVFASLGSDDKPEQ